MNEHERYLFDLQGYITIPNALDPARLDALNDVLDQQIEFEKRMVDLRPRAAHLTYMSEMRFLRTRTLIKRNAGRATAAELTKYAANCMLATKISFMNEMANLAEHFGADIENVRRGIGSDPRIGYQFIYPGCGYGGSCFPKDVQALIRSANQVGYQAKVLESVEAVNYTQKEKLFEYISGHFDGDLTGKTVALWGLSFKPNTDDMREASSRVLMELLWEQGATVQAYDPEAMEETQRIYGSRPDLKLTGTKEAALDSADFLVICTEWQSFRAPDFDLIKEKLSIPLIFDGRNLYDPKIMSEYGLHYYAIGRGLSIKGHKL